MIVHSTREVARRHRLIAALLAITALTAQNTLGVSGIHPVPPAFVAEQMRAIGKTPDAIFLEPAARSTAPAAAIAALRVAEQDPDGLILVLPADHVIRKPKTFTAAVARAAKSAHGRLVTFGIRPKTPETGYGYIEFPGGAEEGSTDAVGIRRFVEKPPLEKAKEYVAAGTYYWNAGMFFWQSRVVLEAMKRFLPKTAGLLTQLPEFGSKNWNAKLAELFPQTENISIDVGVLERAEGVHGIACDEFGWNDVGSWNAVYELEAKSPGVNVARTADIISESAGGCYIDVPKKLVALVGVKDLVVVETDDALLIADRNSSQNVSNIVKALERAKREELL